MRHLIAELEQMAEWLESRGHPQYRLQQIKHWLFAGRARDFDEMTDLPRRFRAELAEEFELNRSQIARHDIAGDGTEKLLLKLFDGQHIECVLLRDGQRLTICVSSQVGCAMGCVFCASGLDGVERNLTSGEIIEQMLHLQRLLPEDQRLSHIVMMGMGEPLANLDAVLPALDVAASSAGLGISPRRITISTVGIPAAILRLANQSRSFNLAVSLHAPDDALRNELVPVNRNIGIRAILDAADRYFDVSGRRLTFEYVLLAGVNDSPKHARQLAQLLRGRCLLLNVIPYNPVVGLPYHTPSATAIHRFRAELERGGIPIRFRQRKGNRINAACGQLRRIVQSPPANRIQAGPSA